MCVVAVVNTLIAPSTKKDQTTQKNPHPLFTGMRVASPGAAPVAAQMEDLDLADHLSINQRRGFFLAEWRACVEQFLVDAGRDTGDFDAASFDCDVDQAGQVNGFGFCESE
jgi:hypothetical protein